MRQDANDTEIRIYVPGMYNITCWRAADDCCTDEGTSERTKLSGYATGTHRQHLPAIDDSMILLLKQ